MYQKSVSLVQWCSAEEKIIECSGEEQEVGERCQSEGSRNVNFQIYINEKKIRLKVHG